MKIAVLGAAGQLGRDLAAQLPGEVHPLTRAEVDLTRRETFAHFHDLHPNIIINCAAYNFVDRAEAEPADAFAVNAFGVRELAQTCQALGCVLVHFSTDYVFGLEQQRTIPYRESDSPGPISVYGSSKLAGEYFARSLCERHFVIRTCGLYGLWGSGGKGGNFVETMLRLAEQKKPLRIVHDQTCTPTFTEDLAAAVVSLLESSRFGLYHLTNTGACTWYEFAAAIFEQAGVPADMTPITSAAYGAPARRPAYSVLDTAHDRAALGLGMRPWREALADYLNKRKTKPKQST